MLGRPGCREAWRRGGLGGPEWRSEPLLRPGRYLPLAGHCRSLETAPGPPRRARQGRGFLDTAKRPWRRGALCPATTLQPEQHPQQRWKMPRDQGSWAMPRTTRLAETLGSCRPWTGHSAVTALPWRLRRPGVLARPAWQGTPGPDEVTPAGRRTLRWRRAHLRVRAPCFPPEGGSLGCDSPGSAIVRPGRPAGHGPVRHANAEPLSVLPGQALTRALHSH